MGYGLSARGFAEAIGEVKRTMCRCPGGSVRAGGTCANVNECVDNPCRHGGTCVDREPARRYDCVCSFGYTGHDCELELLASGIITPSRDFIIAIIVCLFMLLGEHHISFICMLPSKYLYHSSTHTSTVKHLSENCLVIRSLYHSDRVCINLCVFC